MSPLQSVIFRFFRYCSVGILTFIGDLALVYVLYFVFGFGYLSSTTIGFILATIAAFFLNRLWTFDTRTHIWRLVYSLMIAFVSLVIITWCTFIGVEKFALHYLIARSIGAVVATVWSYIADSVVTFQVPPFE